MRHHLSLALLGPALLLAACESNPVAVDDHDDELTVQLSMSSDHVHTLSEITFTVTVTDHHGAAVTDFDTLRVERLAEGSDTWRGIDLALVGSEYTGTYTFASSGEYELRVAGMRAGQTMMHDLYHMTEHLHVARAHLEVGGYRVEFETFPGHIHEGETAEVTFWVMEAEKDAAGNRPPVGGLDAMIECGEADGTTEMHQNTEATTGVYAAQHSFAGAGEFHAVLRFPGVDGTQAEAEFHTHVAHGH